MWADGRLDLESPARARQPALRDPGPLGPAVIRTWHGRMVNEWISSFVFDGLAKQLEAVGEHESAAECRTFAAEERRHGELCAAVVLAAGGQARADVPAPRSLPEHGDAGPRVAALRNAISIACMSETVAVALIGAERMEMPEGELRELLTRIWSDEVGHARFGWRLLDRLAPTLEPAEREAIDRYLPVALAHLEAHELEHLPLGGAPAGGEDYGICSGSDARLLFYETVAEVIVPELEKRGFASKRAWNERKVG